MIRELIDTEANYLEVLHALKTKFMTPMEKQLSHDEIKILFPKIRELVEIHGKFLERLKDASRPNAKCKLSQVFLEFREPFLIYGDYCSNMTCSTDTLRDVCARNASIEQLVQQCQKEHSGGRVQLRDILSVPMQRILKYHLLLDKLVHETLPTHEDYRGLERAKEAMIDVAQYTNEVKRDSEHLVVIQKVRVSPANVPSPRPFVTDFHCSAGEHRRSESAERKRPEAVRPTDARRGYKHKGARGPEDEAPLRVYIRENPDSG